MISLLVRLSETESRDPSDVGLVYSNIDAVGNASGELKAVPDVGPQPFFSGVPQAAGYAEESHLGEAYLGADPAAHLAFAVPIGPVCFGRVRVAVQAVDAVGNAADIGPVATIMVNSAPLPPRNVRVVSVSEGTATLAWSGSPQLRQTA